MENIFIKGSPGTGKTFLARAMAYFMGSEKKSPQEVKNQNLVKEINNIDKYINSEYVEFIQIHPSLSYEDIIYGIDVQAKGTLTLKYTEKRIKSICDRADGKEEKYFIILDDAHRADMSSLLGNLIYAIEYRTEELTLTDGAVLKVPQNIVFIITESTTYINNKIDYALLRRFTYIEELSSDKSILKKYYQDSYVEDAIIDIIMEVYDDIENFCKASICEDLRFRINEYIPGHGMYMGNCTGLSGYEVLRNLKDKIKYQVIPYLNAYVNENIMDGNVEELWIRIQSKMNIGTNQTNQIKNVKKVKSSDNAALEFSLEDTEIYLRDTIYANMPSQNDLRGIMECVIDAMWLNEIFSKDIVFFCLLTNVNIVRFSNRQRPNTYAAYLVEMDKVDEYGYKATNASMRSYFSINNVRTGRWAGNRFAPLYKLTDSKGIEKNYAYLNAFRTSNFEADSPVIHAHENTASIFNAVYRLIKWYYKLYIQEIRLKKFIDIELEGIYNLILLESKYWDLVLSNCKKRRLSVNDKMQLFVKSILNLKLLWNKVDDEINVDQGKFKKLISNIDTMSMLDYEGIFNITSANNLPIKIEGVKKMTDLNNYQDIMDRIGVKQMIFQGPPGTSKTFEARKFVLRQLDDMAYISLGNDFSQQSIGEKLANYKLEESDYVDPEKSPKLKTGGWDIVQFHPSYGYEDFVRGIEVKATGGIPTYENVNRLLGKIAEFAKIADEQATDEEKPKFYLIIDEINRANLATVFGELIYGLEYRDNPISTPYQIKTASGVITKDIVINNNLYIIGTMNTADKSIDGIDYAIRRRFLFIDSPADRKIVEESINRMLNSSVNIPDSIELFLFDAIQLLFSREDYFNNEYQKSDVQMGHTYFLRKSNVEYLEEMKYRFIFQIIPILREYIKEGILDSIEDLKSKENSVEEIFSQTDRDKRVLMASDNIMLYIKYFGTLNKDGKKIDNYYISEWIDSVNEKIYP